jgi:lipoprotein-releasing system permease protein
MFKPLPLYIGLRYTRAKRRNHFISFVSLASMIGIALGVMVLITVLSVMNGFDYEIHNRIFSLARQVTVNSLGGQMANWKELQHITLSNKNVLGVAPYVAGQGMLSKDGYVRGVIITGIDPKQEDKISNMSKTVVDGSMAALQVGKFGIVLGKDIASYLGASLGDKILLITPQATMTPIGVVPRFKRFTVVGVFQAGEGFGYDATTAFINLSDAQKLFQLNNAVTGLNVRITNLYDAPKIADELAERIPVGNVVSNWTDEFGAYFKAIQMEKTMMFVILMFIIAVAAFNLVSSLVMTVTDKQADIAILRTLGASPKTIMSIFIVQGGIIGALGTLLGVIAGIIMALNAPELVKILESVLRTHFISASIYWINYLPSKLEWKDVLQIGASSLFLSLLATIYPAWRAAKTQPAEALRYE